ncbi:uncharacterized protein LOC117034730 [Rhinolophus ferrumequinum]|uniref:uncharacterized protein LOC117034730 n=1 Tax=Rhinolophus ferrumequinum TaxID=59479 RepID=UPI00140F73BB|nr:uncharacterized protein LOC117034730 [Rhinolophus ferrumequinum]
MAVPCLDSQLLTLVHYSHKFQHAEGMSLHCFRGPRVTVEGPLLELQGSPERYGRAALLPWAPLAKAAAGPGDRTPQRSFSPASTKPDPSRPTPPPLRPSTPYSSSSDRFRRALMTPASGAAQRYLPAPSAALGPRSLSRHSRGWTGSGHPSSRATLSRQAARSDAERGSQARGTRGRRRRDVTDARRPRVAPARGSGLGGWRSSHPTDCTNKLKLVTHTVTKVRRAASCVEDLCLSVGWHSAAAVTVCFDYILYIKAVTQHFYIVP